MKKIISVLVIIFIIYSFYSCLTKEDTVNEYDDFIRLQNIDYNTYTVDSDLLFNNSLFPSEFSKQREQVFALLQQCYSGSLSPATMLLNYSTGKIVEYIGGNNRGAKCVYYGEVDEDTLSPNGYGILFDSDREFVYAGHFKNGKIDGYGIIYDGYFIECSDCTQSVLNKTVIRGTGTGYIYVDYSAVTASTVCIENTDMIGLCIPHLIYAGEIKNNERSGQGTVFGVSDHVCGSVLYIGEFDDDEYSGEGTLYYEYPDIIKYTGNFLKGKYSGTGKLYNEDGSLKYSGKFKNGGIAG